MPPPSTFRISASADVNLPPQLSVETGLPRPIKVKLDASAKSEAISASPAMSRHEGRMSLIITGDPEEQPLANVNITVSGEGSGTPTEGLGQAISRFFDAASLMARPVPQLAKPAQ